MTSVERDRRDAPPPFGGMVSAMTAVTLYTRAGCSLCEKAKEAMLRSGIAFDLTEVDIDGDPELRERYTNDVPVILIDGKEAFRHRLTPAEFADYIRISPMASERRDASLAAESCVPCRGGVPPLNGTDIEELMHELNAGWKVAGDHHLEREFRFPDFASALAFTNEVGAIAEREGHHPDIHLAWGRATVTIWTHKIDGLTRSDFVLAAKIDRIA